MPIVQNTIEHKEKPTQKMKVIIVLSIMSTIVAIILFTFLTPKTSKLNYEKSRIEISNSSEKTGSAIEALEKRQVIENKE